MKFQRMRTMIAALVLPLVVVQVQAELNRTCVDNNATRLINSGFNPCLHTEVTEGNSFCRGCNADSDADFPPVVLAHGMFHGAWYWKGMQSQLSGAGYETHAFTFQETTAQTTLQEMSAALYAFILAGAGTGGALTRAPVIVGHSTGGHIVQHFMLTHALLLPEEIRPRGMVLMGSGCNDQPCDTISDDAVQAKLTEMMADGSFNINSAKCNTDMSKALFFLNTTNTTDVSGDELDMAEYACMLRNEQGGAYCTYCVTPEGWEYTTTPEEVSKTMPTLVQQSDLDPLMTSVNSTFMIDHLLNQWSPGTGGGGGGGNGGGGGGGGVAGRGSTRLATALQSHVVGDPNWQGLVATPLIRWMEREIKPSAQTGKSTGYKVGLVFAILAGLVLVVLIGMYVSKRRTQAKYTDIPEYTGRS